jgi:hypothetical protein
MHKLLIKKYEDLSKNPENTTVLAFFHKLSKNASNPNKNKSILLYPGRWNNFDLKTAQSLAKIFLENSSFDVFPPTLTLSPPSATPPN